ncbi:hypothetical protein [Pyruvatibacter sp.]|uniref:hypothetical protein n=1 Tax=Pyruvatibacter sp. TaxID=1981328 RepID=UPI003266BADA
MIGDGGAWDAARWQIEVALFDCAGSHANIPYCGLPGIVWGKAATQTALLYVFSRVQK